MLKNKSFGTCKYNHAIMFDMLIIISCNLLKEQQKWLVEYLPSAAYDSGDRKMHEPRTSVAEKQNMRNRIMVITPSLQLTITDLPFATQNQQLLES
jgi:hypothetical protein